MNLEGTQLYVNDADLELMQMAKQMGKQTQSAQDIRQQVATIASSAEHVTCNEKVTEESGVIKI